MNLRPGLASISCSLPSRSTTIILAIDLSIALNFPMTNPPSEARHKTGYFAGSLPCRLPRVCVEALRQQLRPGGYGVAGDIRPQLCVNLAPQQTYVVIQPNQLLETRRVFGARLPAQIAREQQSPGIGAKVVVAGPSRQIPQRVRNVSIFPIEQDRTMRAEYDVLRVQIAVAQHGRGRRQQGECAKTRIRSGLRAPGKPGTDRPATADRV